MNDQNFAGLKYFPDQRLNIRHIENLDPKSILRGNVRELLGVMNDLAYIDVENDEFIEGSEEAKKLYKLSQYGLQYMIHTVSKLGDNALLLRDYLQIQEDKRKKLLELVNSQEETIKSLKEKKKVLHKTEKHYKKILRTLNTEGEVDEGRDRFKSYDSDQDKKEDVIPLNLPKGRKRGASKGATEPSPKNSEGNIRPQIHTNLDTYSSNDMYSDHKQGIPSNFNRPTTSYGLNTDSGAGENNGRFRVINPPTIETYHDNYPSRETATFKKEDDNEVTRERGENRQEGRAHIRLEDEEGKSNVMKKEIKQPVLNTKTKANDSEDEYEEDFELSESLVPDQFTSKITKMSQSQKKDGVQSSQEKKKNDALFAETTISMDFEKEFDSNYLKNLDNKLSKYK